MPQPGADQNTARIVLKLPSGKGVGRLQWSSRVVRIQRFDRKFLADATVGDPYD